MVVPKNIVTKKYKGLSFEFTFEGKYLEESIIDEIKKSVDIVSNFFHKEHLENINIYINFAYTRAEYNKIIGRKTEPWQIANTSGSNFLIFHPSSFLKETSHLPSAFGKILVHEITHVVTNKINPDFLNWISEGIACLVSDQVAKRLATKSEIDYFINNEFICNTDYFKFFQNGGYEISYILVKKLFDNELSGDLLPLVRVRALHASDDIEKILGKSIKIFKKELLNAEFLLKD